MERIVQRDEVVDGLRMGGGDTRAKYEWIGLETRGGGRYGVISSQFHENIR